MRYFGYIGLLLALVIVLLLSSGTCRHKESATEKTLKDAGPIDLGDNSQPLEIRAYKGAKEVRKQIETQRKEDSKVLDDPN